MDLTIEDLGRRTSTLEKAQGETTETLRWVVAKLGRIQAVQDEHTLRLERLQTKVDGIDVKVDRLEAKVDGLDVKVGVLDARLGSVERKLDGLIETLPSLIAEAMRSVR